MSSPLHSASVHLKPRGSTICDKPERSVRLKTGSRIGERLRRVIEAKTVKHAGRGCVDDSRVISLAAFFSLENRDDGRFSVARIAAHHDLHRLALRRPDSKTDSSLGQHLGSDRKMPGRTRYVLTAPPNCFHVISPKPLVRSARNRVRPNNREWVAESVPKQKGAAAAVVASQPCEEPLSARAGRPFRIRTSASQAIV